MSSATEMFTTVSGDVELPKTFINSLRILFDILDEDKDGYVPVAEIEKRWQGDGISGLPNGVLQSLRKVAPADGSLNFDLFCSALKLTLKTNKERSRTKEHRQPNKAAVRPNNVHPLRSHQSAPHLRVNSLSTDVTGTGEDRLKPKLKSPHLRSHSVSATVDNGTRPTEDPDLKAKVHLGLPPHRGHSLSASNEMEKDRMKPNVRVTSPHYRLNSSDQGSGEQRVKPNVRISSPNPREAHINHISVSKEKMKDRTYSQSDKPVSPTPVKIYPTSVEARSPPPGGQISPRNQSVERVTSPKPKSNYSRQSYPPSYTYPHRRPTHSDNYSNSTSTRSPSSADYEEHPKASSDYATVRARPTVRSPKPGTYKERTTTVSPSGAKTRPSSSSSSATSPRENQHQFKTTVVKSPPPYMAHVKPQSHKVVKAQLVYPQSNTNQNRSTSAPPPRELSNPPKKANRRKKEEPRRHTLSNGITTDFNALKRMKDLEQERDVLHQGLDLLEKCRKWYQEELMGIKEQQHQLITGKEMSRSSHQERVVYRTTRIMDINRQMRALMSSPEAFPDHMNLAMPERSARPVEESPLVNKLKDQNRKLTQEVSFQSERITSLEKEKSTLIRQLFDVRSRPRSKERSRERPENMTLL